MGDTKRETDAVSVRELGNLELTSQTPLSLQAHYEITGDVR